MAHERQRSNIAISLNICHNLVAFMTHCICLFISFPYFPDLFILPLRLKPPSLDTLSIIPVPQDMSKPRDSLVPKAMTTARAAAEVAVARKRGASRRYKRLQLDTLSSNRDLLFLIFQKVRDGLDETRSSPSRSSYEFTTVHCPHSTATSTTVRTITQSRVHDLVQDAFSKICRVNRAWAQVCLPLLWERPKIRTSRQLDRFAYTLEHHGLQYLGYIQELVVRQGSIPDPNSENLWW